MKKIFTLFGALLLWQSVAVAQNYLHISSGDSVKKVRVAELDSVTIRDKYFYGYDWEYLTMGTYTFTEVLSGSSTTPIYKRQMSKDGTKWLFKLENFAREGRGLVISYDSSTGRCHIQPQAIGYTYGDYGAIMIADCATYTGDEEDDLSTFNEETGLFELYVIYYVEAGYLNYGYEYLQLDMEANAPARERGIQEVKFDVSNKVSLKPLTKVSDLQQIKPQTIGDKEQKDCEILQPCTTLEIDK